MNTHLCSVQLIPESVFLITVLTVVQLEFPSLWIKGELAKCCLVHGLQSTLCTKGAIRDVEMGFTSGVKSLGCYNNNYRLDSPIHTERERILGLQSASSARHYQGISWCKFRNTKWVFQYVSAVPSKVFDNCNKYCCVPMWTIEWK